MCTGHDLAQWYGLERAKVVPGARPWDTPTPTKGKASSFAEGLAPETVPSIRPSMALHFAELVAGNGPPGALENPTFGFACWMADLTRLLEQLDGARPPPSRARYPDGPAVTEGAKAMVNTMTKLYVKEHGG